MLECGISDCLKKESVSCITGEIGEKAKKGLKRRSGTASIKPEIKICVNRPIQAFFMFKRIKRATAEKCRRRQNRQTQPTVESFF